MDALRNQGRTDGTQTVMPKSSRTFQTTPSEPRGGQQQQRPQETPIDRFFQPGVRITPEMEREYYARGLNKVYGPLTEPYAGLTKEERRIHMQADRMFPSVGQSDQRRRYIIDEMRAAADRQQGNSYSIRIR